MNKLQKLSVHRPHVKFPCGVQFGYYLAGVIDGDGSIDTQFNKITIAFNWKDIDFAISLRTHIGFGKVSKRARNSVTYVITHPLGLKKICLAINGKLQIKHKINSLENLMERLNIEKNLNESKLDLLNSAYLAGLIDTDGSLGISILNRRDKIKPEVRLRLRISLKKETANILELIHNRIGGNLSERFHPVSKTFSITYDSVSFERIFIILNYLDKYSLQSKHYIRYILVRKAYLLIQNSEHLTEEGLKKCWKYKEMLNNL